MRLGVNASASLPSLDRDIKGRLADLGLEDDAEFLVQLLAESVTSTRRQVAEIRAAFDRGDTESLMFSAHSLKGVSANIGATHLAGLALIIEVAARAQNLDRAAVAVGQLLPEIARVRIQLDELSVYLHELVRRNEQPILNEAASSAVAIPSTK